MSRIGMQPVELPEGVEVEFQQDSIEVSGPNGTLERDFHPGLNVTLDDENSAVSVENPQPESDEMNALHGTTRSVIENMVEGVSEGYKEELRLVGTGYKVSLKGSTLVLSVGFSEDVEREVPDGLEVEVPNEQAIVIEGVDKQAVGQFAAEVRKIRPPEPYNQKGIRYKGEDVRQKEGKKFVSGV